MNNFTEQPLDTQKNQTPNRISCPHCWAENHVEPTSMQERVADLACAIALLAVLLPIGYFANQWIDKEMTTLTPYQILRAPLGP